MKDPTCINETGGKVCGHPRSEHDSGGACKAPWCACSRLVTESFIENAAPVSAPPTHEESNGYPVESMSFRNDEVCRVFKVPVKDGEYPSSFTKEDIQANIARLDSIDSEVDGPQPKDDNRTDYLSPVLTVLREAAAKIAPLMVAAFAESSVDGPTAAEYSAPTCPDCEFGSPIIQRDEPGIWHGTGIGPRLCRKSPNHPIFGGMLTASAEHSARFSITESQIAELKDKLRGNVLPYKPEPEPPDPLLAFNVETASFADLAVWAYKIQQQYRELKEDSINV